MTSLLPATLSLRISRRAFYRISLLSFTLAALVWVSHANTVTRISVRPSVQQPTEVLSFGEPVRREITGGQKHIWVMTLAAGQYFQLTIEPRDIAVVAVVSDPDHKQLLEVSAPCISIGETVLSVISFIAEKSGSHTLEIRAKEPAETGHYEMKAEEPRTASEQDSSRIRAHRLWAEGAQMRTHNTSEARQTAIGKYEEALAILQQAGDKYGQAVTLNTIASIWYELTNAQKVTESQSKALTIWQALGRQREEGITLSELGLICFVKYDYQKTLDYYGQALAKHRAVGDVNYEGETLNRIGWAYNSQGEKRKALEYYEQSLHLRREAGNREGESVTLNDIGRAYSDLGEGPQALEFYQQALRLRPPERNPGGAANILNRIGVLYRSFGEWQKALDAYNQALALVRQVNNRRTEAALLSNIGVVLDQAGDSERALEYFEQALKLSRETGLRNGEASILHSTGVAFFHLGEKQKAIEFLKQALEIRRAIRDGAGEAVTLEEMGVIYHFNGEYQKASEVSLQSLEKFRALGGNAEESYVLTGIANGYAALGDRQKALETYEQALIRHRQTRDRAGEAQTLYWQGRTRADLGELAEARSLIEQGIAISESLRGQGVNQELRTSYESVLSDHYRLYIDVLMAAEREQPGAGNAALALQASERRRARSLLELLTESNADIRQGADPTLLAAERALQRRLNAKAEIQTRLLGGKHTEEQAAAIAREISEVTSQLSEAAAKIRAASPRYAALTEPVPLSLSDIQRQVLDDDTLLLEYSLDKKHSYLWAVTKDSFHSFTLPGAGEIEPAARRLLDLLPKSTQRRYRRETELAAAELGGLILKPVAGQLTKKRLLIVADGLLQYIPFAALPLAGSSGGGEPLLAKHEIISMPSASALAVLRHELSGRKPAEKQLAVFSDPVFQADDPRVRSAKAGPANQLAGGNTAPAESSLALRTLTRSASETGVERFERLPFVRQEAEAITSLISKTQQLKALDFAASRTTALGGQLEKYRIIHFATHGLLNSRHPDLSGVVLSLVDETGKPQDGFLRLNDLYNLKLNADLVVLSACSTALGKEVRGEGLIGLTRGFMYAGAARVVASLWNVNDAATTELMKRFYKAMLTDRMTPAAALRAAQLGMSRDPRWSAPYYWSGFVLQGEWK